MKNKKSVKYLVLWLADFCNLNCKYCYASPNFSNKFMSIEIAKKAISKYTSKNFTLILAGGEPLLNFTLIEEIYDYIKKNNYSCKIGLQTNGTLITDEIAKKLSKMNINIGLSFDGDIKTNEELRGKSSEVIRGIKFLSEHNKKINLNCVVSNKNIDKLENLVDIAYYFGNVNGIGIDLLRKNETSIRDKSIDVAPKEKIYINLKKANEKIKLLTKLTGKKIGIREIEETKFRKCFDCSSENYCYSSLGEAMVVIPNGDTYPCSSLVGNKEYYMGNIEDNVNIIKLNSGKYKDCENCFYKKNCKGCCPSRLILNQVYDSQYTDCVLRKAVFRILEEEKRDV